MVSTKKTLEKFGDRVKEERTRLSLSQEALATKAGMHRTYVGMIERAEKNITLENIDKLARALGVSIAKLFE